MQLTVREAATLLGRSPRTLRAQLARGELVGRKLGAQWRIDRRDLPLTERQRQAVLERSDTIREAVDDALPRLDSGRRSGRRSALDLEPLQHARRLLAEWDALEAPRPAGVDRARPFLRQALTDLCRGAHAWDRDGKVAALRLARDGMSRAVGALVSDNPDQLPPTHEGWIETLEARALASLGGLLRWAEKLGRGKPTGPS